MIKDEGLTDDTMTLLLSIQVPKGKPLLAHGRLQEVLHPRSSLVSSRPIRDPKKLGVKVVGEVDEFHMKTWSNFREFQVGDKY